MAVAVACSNMLGYENISDMDTSGNRDSDTYADTDPDTDTDADSDTSTNTDPDTDTNADSDTSTNTDPDTDTDADSDNGTDTSISTDTNDDTEEDEDTEEVCIPALRDCRSSLDNNCDGTADNEEPECTVCTLDMIQNCNEHPGFDGIGTCEPGQQVCSETVNHDARSWGPCLGGVGPATEGCGPGEEDTNCNGIAGDGNADCTFPIKIWRESSTEECDSGDGQDYYRNGKIKAALSSPGDDWTEIASFRVFSDSQPGTSPVRNCQIYDQYSRWWEFVRIGGSCGDVGETNDLGIVGYVAYNPATGYDSLNFVEFRYTYYMHVTPEYVAHVPVGTDSCPSTCACVSEFNTGGGDEDYYVIP